MMNRKPGDRNFNNVILDSTYTSRDTVYARCQFYYCLQKTKSVNAELKYKNYRNIFKKIALEAENIYYQELFNTKTNTIKQLWKNLNTVASFKKK